MLEFPYRVERSVLIGATPSTVFRFFTDSARWANWWGQGSTIEPRKGGKVYIRHSNGVETIGEVLKIEDPRVIAFTYGFPSGSPIPVNGSRVTISLNPDDSGTRLHLLHEFKELTPAEEHIQGWRFQLSLFSNLVANEVFADCSGTIDAWFDVWAVADAVVRTQALAGLAAPNIQFRDRFSLLDGIDDVTAHIGAYQRFLPGLVFKRAGDLRQCQGAVLADWIASGADRNKGFTGTTFFRLEPDGRIGSVISFAGSPAPETKS